ncbi:MAG TPA: sigma-70 family RNA polymerase sigma factor [Chloroflexia bacterium]|nr:sigma-70 family RNA polymerase sigma factor [Chloroflexia bacterium]
MSRPWEIDQTIYTDEAELLEGLRRRDRMACTCLLKRFAPRLYRLALQISGNPDDAEDILQESFIQACNHLDSFEGRSGLSTWLHRIVLNAALMQLRKRGPLSQMPPEWEESRLLAVGGQQAGALGAGEAPGDHVLSHVLSQELHETIDRAILALPDALRAAIVLRDVEGLSTSEAAQALGITESAVKVRLHRARLALRQALTPYLQEQAAGERGTEG